MVCQIKLALIVSIQILYSQINYTISQVNFTSHISNSFIVTSTFTQNPKSRHIIRLTECFDVRFISGAIHACLSTEYNKGQKRVLWMVFRKWRLETDMLQLLSDLMYRQKRIQPSAYIALALLCLLLTVVATLMSLVGFFVNFDVPMKEFELTQHKFEMIVSKFNLTNNCIIDLTELQFEWTQDQFDVRNHNFDLTLARLM